MVLALLWGPQRSCDYVPARRLVMGPVFGPSPCEAMGHRARAAPPLLHPYTLTLPYTAPLSHIPRNRPASYTRICVALTSAAVGKGRGSAEGDARRPARSRTNKAREERLARIARLKGAKGRGAANDDDEVSHASTPLRHSEPTRVGPSSHTRGPSSHARGRAGTLFPRAGTLFPGAGTTRGDHALGTLFPAARHSSIHHIAACLPRCSLSVPLCSLSALFIDQ